MTPIVLIPGNMCDERLWRPVARLLREDGRTVIDAPRLDQDSVAAMADTVAEVLPGPCHIIGFSMGAIIACALAVAAPARVAGLGLIAFNASADLPERAAVRPGQQHRVRAGALETIVADELKPNYLADENKSDRALLDTVMEMARALGPEAFVAQSEALRLRGDLRPSLSGLSMPVLLCCGSEDRLCPPAWHRRWADMIGANATVIELAGAGHLVPLEQPDALARAILGWLPGRTLCLTRS